MNEYFLTGATGVVGNAIAEKLLSQPDNRITLLIRAGSAEELDSRLQSLFQFWQIDPNSIKGRVRALSGDTTLPQFGLQPEEFNRLGEESSHIIHCAALVRMNLPIEEARKSALGAAKNIAHLAELCHRNKKLKKVEFLSTVGVGGRWEGVLPERWITESRTFHNTYEQAKAEAETYIHEKITKGLPITVHRPSMVVGNSASGQIIRFQIFYHLVEFLTGKRTFGIFPSFAEAKLDIVPVNYVTEAVVWSSMQESTVGQVLHLCSGAAESLSIEELQQHIRTQWEMQGSKLPSIKTVPAGLFRAALPIIRAFSPKELRRAINTLPIFLDYLADNQSFGNKTTCALLQAQNILLPPVKNYIPKILNHYLATTKHSSS